MTIKELCKKAHKTACEKGFWEEDRNKAELLMLIVSEISEALEALRESNYIKNRTYKQKPNTEIWKEIPGYEEDYFVSNWGNVRSIGIKTWGGQGFYIKPKRILLPYITKEGYRTVALRGKTFKISRLVALAFLPIDNNRRYVNHINCNKLDDNINNLEWCTSSENNKHAIEHKLKNMSKKLSIEQCLDILSNFKYQNKSLKELAEKFNVHISSIKKAKQRAEKELKSFEMELADAVIRIADLAESQGIDLEWQISKKLEYNQTRPQKHGKAF
jgi:NTP pyrophosphatase (non-canonical NTP hydrolase)